MHVVCWPQPLTDHDLLYFGRLHFTSPMTSHSWLMLCLFGRHRYVKAAPLMVLCWLRQPQPLAQTNLLGAAFCSVDGFLPLVSDSNVCVGYQCQYTVFCACCSLVLRYTHVVAEAAMLASLFDLDQTNDTGTAQCCLL